MNHILNYILESLDKYKTNDTEYYQTLHTILLNMETVDDMTKFYEIINNANVLNKKLYINKEITNGAWDSISLSDISII